MMSDHVVVDDDDDNFADDDVEDDASVVAEVGSLFLRFRASICKSCRQRVHKTAAKD